LFRQTLQSVAQIQSGLHGFFPVRIFKSLITLITGRYDTICFIPYITRVDGSISHQLCEAIQAAKGNEQ
jgi:hypothetical protein